MRPAFARAQVMVGGPGHARADGSRSRRPRAARASSRNLFCRYSDYLLAQIMQTVACNSFHPIQQRAARWLLTAQDRAGDRLELTQEALAGLLGVQRTTVNAVVGALQDEGLITHRRGRSSSSIAPGWSGRPANAMIGVEDISEHDRPERVGGAKLRRLAAKRQLSVWPAWNGTRPASPPPMCSGTCHCGSLQRHRALVERQAVEARAMLGGESLRTGRARPPPRTPAHSFPARTAR